MALAHGLRRYFRGFAWGAGAMCLHLGMVLALPAAPVPAEEKPTHDVWFDAWVSASPDTVGLSAHLLAPGTANVSDASSVPAGRSTVSPARSVRRRSSARAQQAAAKATCGASDTAGEAGGAAFQAATAGGEPSGQGGSSSGAPGGGNRAGASGSAAHGPGLLVSGSPCAGYFPASAESDLGEVQIAVEVDLQGHARGSSVLIEQPRGQGFGGAARACAARLQFAPAVDASGAVVSGQAKIKLRFRRPAMS